MTDYILDTTVAVRPNQVKFTLSGHLFTYLGVFECPCCLGYDIFLPALSCLWTNAFRLTDGRRLSPSLKLFPYTILVKQNNPTTYWDIKR